MLNRSASLAMSTCVLKALPGKLDIKRHSPSILYLLCLHYEGVAYTSHIFSKGRMFSSRYTMFTLNVLKGCRGTTKTECY